MSDTDTFPSDVILPGTLPGHVFVCLSGLGSSVADLMPLATAISEQGYRCELLTLPYNATNGGDWPPIDTASVIDRIEAAVAPHRSSGTAVYLVGFSLGATFALIYAADHACNGVIAISAFLRPARRRLAKIFLAYRRWMNHKDILRSPQVTAPETRTELHLSPTLPIHIVEQAFALGATARSTLPDIKCSVLFLHSFDDRVADYAIVARSVQLIRRGVARLVSFNQLNHYIQFDIHPYTLARFGLHYLGVPMPAGTKPAYGPVGDQPRLAMDLLKLYSEERRHWSLIVFQTIAGFFTAFFVLVYNTLRDVITSAGNAPYYLLSYSLVSSLYLILSILYFFYANRVDVYIKFHIEPLMPGSSWAAFRTSKWMTGPESYATTRLATVPLGMIPTVVSVLCLAACGYLYRRELLAFELQYAVLDVLFLLATILCLFALYEFRSHGRFTHRWLYVAHPAERSDFETESLIFGLYEAVSPGCVRQPRPLRRTQS